MVTTNRAITKDSVSANKWHRFLDTWRPFWMPHSSHKSTVLVEDDSFPSWVNPDTVLRLIKPIFILMLPVVDICPLGKPHGCFVELMSCFFWEKLLVI